jgi:hypothetical protein
MVPSLSKEAEIAAARDEERAAAVDGIYLTPRADGDNGVPIGLSPSDLRGQVVKVDPYLDGGEGFEFTLDGMNDPELLALGETREARAAAVKSTNDILAGAYDALYAVAQAKKGRAPGPAAPQPAPGIPMYPQTPSQPHAAPQPAPTEPARIGPVVWDMGARGQQYAYYDHASIQTNSLILATRLGSGRDTFIPPVAGDAEQFVVTLPDESVPPVPVYSVGVVFRFQDYLVCVFPIVRG